MALARRTVASTALARPAPTRTTTPVVCALLAALAGPARGAAPALTETATLTDAPPRADELARPTATATLADSSVPAGQSLFVDVRERRLGRPFDPHATRVLTGRQIAELGVANLAEALEQLPNAYVRSQGRGGTQVDLRGARKGAVLVLVDGVPVSDPFFGSFDVTTIPATDISEIRVSSAPASPIDGPGGNGGVIEVVTRSALGRTRAFLRGNVSSVPSARGAASVKGELGGGLGVRASATGALDARRFDVLPSALPPTTLDQAGRHGHGALLVEWARGPVRVGADATFGRQSYVVPPSEDVGADLQQVDGETTLRASLAASVDGQATRASARAFAQSLSRSTLRWRDADRSVDGARADVEATRFGAVLRAEHDLDATLGLALGATFVHERGRESSVAGDGADGQLDLLQAGASARWRPEALDALVVDLALGAAVPLDNTARSDTGATLGETATPWPEARAALTYTLGRPDANNLELSLVGGRKGRLPTLRERFQPSTGNPSIAPEQASYGELAATWRPTATTMFRAVGWARHVDGLIKIPLGGDRLANVGSLVTGGGELRVDVGLFARALELGAAYLFQAQTGDDALDFFPAHRGEAWVRGRLGAASGAWLRVKYLGARVDQAVTLEPWTSVDVGLWHKVDAVRLLARVENTLDAAWSTQAGVPGVGRAVWLGLELDMP
jgi:hypothetical protein